MTQFVIGWNIGGHEMILQDYFSGNPRFFESQEEAQTIADELVKDTGTCRVLPVQIVPVSDPPETVEK